MSSICIEDAVPARTLFVAESWSTTVSPTTHFTTIAAALVQAATLTPTRSNPVVIIVYPGTYSDALSLVSNVHIFGHTRRDVVITGIVTWTPGSGVNAPQALISEEIDIAQVRFEGPIAIDSSSKPETGQGVALDLRNVDARNVVTTLSRSNNEDHFQAWDCTLIGALTFTNTIVNLSGGTYVTLSFHGSSDANIAGDQPFGTITLSDTAVVAMEGSQIIGDINVGAGCSIEIVGSALESDCTLTIAAGGTAEIRSSNYKNNGQLVGPGAVDRSLWRTTFGPTVIGNNVVPINPPYTDGNYQVAIENTAAVLPTIVSKAAGSFVINDTVGGGTFNFALQK